MDRRQEKTSIRRDVILLQFFRVRRLSFSWFRGRPIVEQPPPAEMYFDFIPVLRGASSGMMLVCLHVCAVGENTSWAECFVLARKGGTCTKARSVIDAARGPTVLPWLHDVAGHRQF